MNTITIWLLVSVGFVGTNSYNTSTVVLEKFSTKELCEDTLKQIGDGSQKQKNWSYASTPLKCVSAVPLK